MPSESFQNRLITEKSPYLLQHAHNPVDWFPWGEEAFNASKEQDKPIFLSIGYATCHWCHVMSRESFDNPEIASLMNETYINVKVDREELPEIDSLYMEFAQALMASGTGWPLNLILTPELKPFYATTYLPPESRQDMMGMKELTHHIAELWKSDERDLLNDQAEKLVDLFARSVQTQGEELPDESYIDSAIEVFFEAVDPVYGGIKGAPKFPMGYQTHFFLQYAHEYQDSRPLFYVEMTLDMMRRGGIYDQVGGGFSRYSIDEKWTIPHFEKMLYDNAILARAYLVTWQMTKKPFYQSVVEDILGYVLREMQHTEGGFYSAEDAETEGKEGAYYIWSYQEIKEAIPSEDFDLFCDFYGVSESGNFEGSNVLHRTCSPEEFAELRGLDLHAFEPKLEAGIKILYELRLKRKRPFKDDKILVSWNAMMIDTLTRAGVALNSPKYIENAKQAALFIKKHLWKEGKLLRRYRDGQTDFEGGLEDYAYLIRALITLFEADQGSEWLQWALEMTTILEDEFKAEEGAFYQTSSEHSILLRRPELSDGAQPSGNAIHAENLLRLEQLTYNREYRIQAEDILKVAASYMEAYPMGACYHLIALQRYLDKEALLLVIALNDKEDLKDEIKQFISQAYLPNASIVWKHFNDKCMQDLLPNLVDLSPIDNQTTLYVCQQGRCQAPLTAQDEIRAFFKL